jgi:HSP20 family protein
MTQKQQSASKSDRDISNPSSGSSPASGSVTWQRIIIRQSSVWKPPTDVYQAEDRLIIVIEVAGMRDGDFHLVLQNRRLIVSGVRNHPIDVSALACHQLEIPRGEFRTEVYVPWTVQRDQVTAIYRDGLLRIELPQAEPQPIHIINVNADE